MKKKALVCFFCAALVCAPAQAAEAEYHWNDKLWRGAVNIVTSPVEVARSIQITANEDSLLEGWTVGLVKGLGSGVVRFGAGVLDLFTFPLNFPDPHKGPLVEPEYVWQKPGVRYTR